MNYGRIYNELISNAKSRDMTNSYYETHHIIPRCLGGDDSVDNLVNLTFREHYIAHWLLCKIHRNYKLASAFHMMCSTSSNQQRAISSRMFESARLHFMMNHPAKSEEVRKKISESVKEYFKNNPIASIKVSKTCICGCGNTFMAYPNDSKKFYSSQCANSNRAEETNEKVSNTMKEMLSSLTVEERHERMKKSALSCDQVKRGQSISASKKGKSTNQQMIMGQKYSAMTDEEFQEFISAKTLSMQKRMMNLRNRYLNS